MGDHPSVEEAGGAPGGAIHELIHEDQGAGWQVLAEGADGIDREQVRDADPLEAVDVGAVVDAAGCHAMSRTVPGQEGDRGPAQFAEQQGGGRYPEGTRHLLPALVVKSLEMVQAASTDDPEQG